MQTKENTRCDIKEENRKTWRKNVSAMLQVGNNLQVNELEYKNTNRLSKPKLLNVLEHFKL